MKIVLGDLNAQIGSEVSGWEEVIGKNAVGDLNDNGETQLLQQQQAKNQW